MRIEGRLVSGLGRAAGFTQLDWVRRQLVEIAGIDPHPGTANLSLDDDHAAAWRECRGASGEAIEPPDASFCRARCHPVRVGAGVPAAILLPEIADYPHDKVELVAALPLRAHLRLRDGERLAVEMCGPIRARAVLFDLDGTLVDTVGAYVEVARAAAQPHGLSVSEAQVRRALATGSSFWSEVLPADVPDRDALTRALLAVAVREWPRILRERGRALAGLAATVDSLHGMGMRLGIVSGARREVLQLLRDEEVLDGFEAVVLGPDVARRKPDPEGILLCLDRLGVAPNEAVYVGDTPIDIQASRAAGVSSVAVLTGAADGATLSPHHPDRLIASHARLSAIVEPR